ncbi:hypothetical protein [Halomonas alimentaria]|uniref:Fap amyloid fibril minor component n=1 Tax=Halomonas alimentaria TaxID=147248 RepID=A0A7X5AN58_9GAMM|nr:hypothetical protein [Halomonas alimentaria]NAW33710.1 hypothetical protein [Halomonas alimentaria]
MATERFRFSMQGRPVRVTAIALALGLIAGLGQSAMADLRNSSVVEGNALSGITGVSTTNMAAGDGNLQSNSGVVVMGTTVSAANTLMQSSRIEQRIGSQDETVGIKGRAFRQSEGWLSINQAAGQGNVQSNSMGVALGISASNLSDATLQQVLADQQGLRGTDEASGSTQRRIEVDKTSFAGARGIIQVNQSAGTGNATRNSFRMNMALGQ